MTRQFKPDSSRRRELTKEKQASTMLKMEGERRRFEQNTNRKWRVLDISLKFHKSQMKKCKSFIVMLDYPIPHGELELRMEKGFGDL